MKRIGVLTSGGDAPGMNAAVRAVVRTALDEGVEVFGVRRGFAGLIDGDMKPLGARDVGGIIQQGGTVLSSARCPEFREPTHQAQAAANLKATGVSGLVVIGGDGSQAGALALENHGVAVAGIASTIDNDLYGADVALGVDSALNVALEAVDRLKVTAASHQRAFLVEVMGRHSGYLALSAGIAGGAEMVVLPEVETTPGDVAAAIKAAYARGKGHAIVVVCEGAAHNAKELVRYFDEHRKRLGYEVRATTLGHVQRGASPGAFDRLLGSRCGHAAVKHLLRGDSGVLIGLVGGKITATKLTDATGKKKVLSRDDIELARCLAAY